MIELRTTSVAGDEQDYYLDVGFDLRGNFLSPNLKVLPLHREHSHRFGLIIELLEGPLEHLDQLLGLQVIFVLVKDTPLLDSWLVEQLVLGQRQEKVLTLLLNRELESFTRQLFASTSFS